MSRNPACFYLLATVLLVLCLLAAALGHAVTPANTLIEARAEITYFDPELKESNRVLSNTASFRVAAVAALRLEEDQQQLASAGEQVVFIHRLTSLGNSPDRYRLILQQGDLENGLEQAAIFIYQGALPLPDATPVTETPELAPGEAIELVVLATVPTEALTGEKFVLTLSAISVLDEQVQASNRDQVTRANRAVRILKTVDRNTARPGDDLHYRLDMQNIGDTPLPTREVVVDGQPLESLLLEDPIPPYTRLHPVRAPTLAPVQASAVLRTRAGEWIRYEHWDHRETVTRIGLLLPPEHFAPGQSARLDFATVIAEDTADETLIVNQATLPLTSNRDGPDFASNEVTTRTEITSSVREPAIRFVQPKSPEQTPLFSGQFLVTNVYYLHIASGDTRRDVYLEAEGGNFQQTAEQQDTLEVTVFSDTGDKVRVLLQETAPNSGLFRSQAPLHLSIRGAGDGNLCRARGSIPDYSQAGVNCQLKSRVNDYLRAEVMDPLTQQHYFSEARVSPTGKVFNSVTFEPLGHTRIRFTDLQGEVPISPETNQPVSDQVTDSNGQFTFPHLPYGYFFIKVIPPSGYHFPSALPPERFPPTLHVGSASYGESAPPRSDNREPKGGINIDGAFGAFPDQPLESFDVPVDPVATESGTAMMLTKEALPTEVAPGEAVNYTLILKNGGQELDNLQLLDNLPFGFRYLPGSIRVNDQPVPDPASVTDGQLTFRIPDSYLPLATEGEVKISYALQAGAAAMDGDGINRARSHTDINGQIVYSEEATARVRIKMTGVLSDRAILFGKVYVDSNGDGIQNPGEWPIGGVRIYMEDGTWAVTDENGQYSLMGIRSSNHVLRVDPITLPEGLTLTPLDNRNAADAGSRFVDLAPGEMHRADFAAECPVCGTGDSESIFNQIKARNQDLNGDWLLEDMTRFHRTRPQTQADSSGDLSHGIIRAPRESPATTQKTDSQSYNGDGSSVPVVIMPVTSEVISTVTRQQAEAGTWLWPAGTSADGRFMVVVRGGVNPTLYLNGKPVSDNHLGEQLVNLREQAQVLAWYGIPLEEGINQLSVRASDAFGNERILASGQFTHAGTAVSLRVTPAAPTLPADGGSSQLPVRIELLDKQGQPARGVHFITLESSAGHWQEKDTQNLEPGHQVRIDQGAITVHLLSGTNPGPVTLRASTGGLRGEAEITLTAAPRPLFALGMVEVNAGYGQLSSPVPDLDEIEDDYSDHGRAAVFIKGEVARDTQLTLAYDSQKKEDTELFRDVDPYDYYPITGDASQQGYEAQSSGKFYGKLEKDRHSLLWGDYQTDSQGSDNNLARIQRNLNGVNGIYDNGTTRLEGFAARPDNQNLTEIILPDGTAMNYRLRPPPLVRHSETVILETLGRDNPGLVLQSETLSRVQDYIVDYHSGYLRFSQPVLRYDEQGNPRQIRVNYDVEGDGREYTLAGIRLIRKLGDSLLGDSFGLGLSYTHDDDHDSGTNLSGGWLQYQPSEHTAIVLSGAYMTEKITDSDPVGPNNHRGNALRVTARHRWANDAKTELNWARADQDFNNSGSGISPGREETRLQHRHPLGERLNLRAAAELSRDLKDSGTSQGDSLGAYLDHRPGHGWQLSAGGRYIHQRSETDQNHFLTGLAGLAGLEKRFQLLSRDASVKAEYEHAFDHNRWRTEVISDWKVHDKVGLYGRFERDDRLNPIASDTDRNQFALEVKSDWLTNTSTYSEYRLRGATNGDSLEWVNGADSRLEIIEGLAISPSIEWINTVSGEQGNDGLALSMGLQDKRGSGQRANGRVEYRHGKQQDYYGLDAAVARRLSTDWSGLVREEYRQESRAHQQRRTRRQALTLGLARRPTRDNCLHGLYLYQWKEEDGARLEDNRRVHLFSTHQNWQISPGRIFSGRLGGKWVQQSMDQSDYRGRMGLADTRLTLDLNRRWDLDLRGGLLAVAGTNSRRWSIGFGLHYLLDQNFRVGAWYNRIGFSDKDLDAQGYNAEGIHLSLQFKFDESLFGWFRL